MAGLWFEELSLGQIFDHPLRRTVTETDNVMMTTMTPVMIVSRRVGQTTFLVSA